MLSNSFFLFGARGTGKSTLLRSLLPQEKALWVDLTDPEREEMLLRDPLDLIRWVKAQLQSLRPRDWVVIDEVQKALKFSTSFIK